MKIKQWEEKQLSQYSYGILSNDEKKIVLIDPSRDPQPYLDWAKENDAVIAGIIETHPHADFISSHLELHQKTNATIYVHSLVGATYPHQTFDHGEVIELGKIRLIALHTPGHSPDSISILLENNNKQRAIFTGDTLFIGDCGRPDLREGTGNIHAKREALARQMYYSLQQILMKLDDEVIVYPAHGAGTLCGKNLSSNNSSTMKIEKKTNWSLQDTNEKAFISNLLSDQPFIPRYFPYDVELNRRGATGLDESINRVILKSEEEMKSLAEKKLCIDVRSEKLFKQGHFPGSINIMEEGQFETWLGSIVSPSESFLIVAEDKKQLMRAIRRAASIGYESHIIAAAVLTNATSCSSSLDINLFLENLKDYTIVDVRNVSEVKQYQIFDNSLNIPLPELRDRLGEIPITKPIVVHCAGGYRSAAAASIIDAFMNGATKVFNLGKNVQQIHERSLTSLQYPNQ